MKLVVIVVVFINVCMFLLVRRVERGAVLILSIGATGLRSHAQPGKYRVRSRGGALRVPQ
jgi:hypothetical protein